MFAKFFHLWQKVSQHHQRQPNLSVGTKGIWIITEIYWIAKPISVYRNWIELFYKLQRKYQGTFLIRIIVFFKDLQTKEILGVSVTVYSLIKQLKYFTDTRAHIANLVKQQHRTNDKNLQEKRILWLNN